MITDAVRASVRFPMKLSLRMRTEAGTLEATTEDISANGILFTGAELPGVDTNIEFTIQMPGSIMGTLEDVSVHCLGRVVRHQVRDGDLQAAAIIDEYYLRA